MSRKKAPTRAYRWQVVARAVAAIFGGYALAVTASIGLARVLPLFGAMQKSDALMTALLVSFALWTAAVLWAFAARSVRSAWLGILAPTLPLAAMAWLQVPGAAA